MLFILIYKLGEKNTMIKSAWPLLAGWLGVVMWNAVFAPAATLRETVALADSAPAPDHDATLMPRASSNAFIFGSGFQ